MLLLSWLSDVVDELVDLFMNMLHTIMLFLDQLVYSFIGYLYRLFSLLATFDAFSVDTYNTFVNKIYILLGVVMLFVLVYGFFMGVINPDKASESGVAPQKIIINIVISIVIITILPTAFQFIKSFQNTIIVGDGSGSVLQKLIFNSADGSSDPNATTITLKNGGYTMAINTFSPFFQGTSEFCGDETNVDECEKRILVDDGKGGTISLSETKKKIGDKGNFWLLTKFTPFTFDNKSDMYGRQDEVKQINHMFPVSTIAGVFLCYVMVSFCFDLGKRCVKLLFLQIIAPIPVICRAIPKAGDVFSNWLKQIIAVYLEVFTRMLAMYFGVFLINLLMSNISLWSHFSDEGFFIVGLAKAFVIMGLIAFVKELPKFLGNLFPGMNSDGMSLGIKDKLKAGGAFTAGAALGAGATSLVRNGVKAFGNRDNWKNKNGRVTAGSVMRNLGRGATSTVAGATSGIARGLLQGRNAGSLSEMRSAASGGADAASQARENRQQYRASHGGTLGGVIRAHAADALKRTGDYFGINSIADKKKENDAIDKVQGLDKSLGDGIESDILSAAGKGKNYTYGTSHNTAELYRLQSNLEAARQKGDPEELRKAEAEYNKYKKGFIDEIKATTFKDDKAFESAIIGLNADEEATLRGAHTTAETLKTEALKNVGSRFINQTNETAAKTYILQNEAIGNFDAKVAQVEFKTDPAGKQAAEVTFDDTMAEQVRKNFDSTTAQKQFNVTKKAQAETHFDLHVAATAATDFDTNVSATVAQEFKDSHSAAAINDFQTTMKASFENNFDTTMKSAAETDFNSTQMSDVLKQYNEEAKKRTIILSAGDEKAARDAFVSQKRDEYVQAQKDTYVQAQQDAYVQTQQDAYVSQAKDDYVSQKKTEYVQSESNNFVKKMEDAYVQTQKKQFVQKQEDAYVKSAKETFIDEYVNTNINDSNRTFTVEQINQAFEDGVTKIDVNSIRNGEAFIDTNGKKAAGGYMKNVGKVITAQNNMDIARADREEKAKEGK